MRIKKINYNTIVNDNNSSEKARDDTFVPITIPSIDYKTWRAVLYLKTCFNCADNHGRIFDIKDSTVMLPPLHMHCRCTLEEMEAIEAGNATNNRLDGADFELKHNGHLPDYYISSFELEELGWQIGDRPSKYAPNRILGGDVYQNRDRRLPHKIGRVWYEADINYTTGRRNLHRILWSNDGLIFVTYDHYHTFLK
ncbi:MAG: phage head morphogenesis protein [Ruminococcus sp.]|nr:phage head morphogenesis protein [Ruminococcus sp.]